MPGPNFCRMLMDAIYHNADTMVGSEVDRIDSALEVLHEKLSERRKEAASLKKTVHRLNDTSVKFDTTSSMSRKTMLNHTMYRLKVILGQIESLENQINFFFKAKVNIENSMIAEEVAESISFLKDQLTQGLRGIDPDQLQQDLDDLEGVSQEMNDTQNMVADNIKTLNTWNQEEGDLEQMLEDFLAQEDDDSEGVPERNSDEQQAPSSRRKSRSKKRREESKSKSDQSVAVSSSLSSMDVPSHLPENNYEDRPPKRNGRVAIVE
mmetsp:Transcript_65/g.218  ORF Transcript_65/g.218 Transcript_65/m.218 type:complete len:265 (+) Transcript_65:1215-2009(+)